LDGFIYIGPHIHRYREIHPDDIFVGIRLDLALHKLDIGDHYPTQIKCLNDNVSDSNLINLTKNASSWQLFILHLNQITNLVIFGRKNENTCNQVADNFFGCESDTNGKASYDQSDINSDYLKS